MSRSRLSKIFHSPEKSNHSAMTRSSSPASSSHSLSDMSSPSSNKFYSEPNEGYGAKYSGDPMILGVCAMDVKARSKAMREILTRLVERANGGVEVKVFGDKVILDEDVENWPRCDVLISFFSTDFPLDKATQYVKLRNPLCINDLPLQALLWDRRLVGAVLDHLQVPTPKRIEVSRDGGPQVDPELRALVKSKIGLEIGELRSTPEVSLREDGDAIIIDGKVLEKPFVEKPVSGEDHNVYIYYRGGGGRRLFRKVGNKSSELDPNLKHPRTDGSYIYEQFIDVDNSEDIKVYTVGQEYTHAETRKSPVVDGVVRRNTDGKEIRFITRLTEEERSWAKKICMGFGQRVCGYDMLRCDNGQRSQVIDVNGWSFVKGNESYYDKAAEILASLCLRLSTSPDRPIPHAGTPTSESPTWLLKANVTVFRHADRTPKQKLKFNFPIGESWTQPFVTLLNGEKEEIILREKKQLNLVVSAIEQSKSLGATGEDLMKLTQLSNALFSKIDLPGTKAQLKPYSNGEFHFSSSRVTYDDTTCRGGEFTHAARYQSRDLGENMKKDLTIMNKDALNNVKIFTSSERRVIASAEIFAAALVDSQNSAYSAPSSTTSSVSSRSLTDITQLSKMTPNPAPPLNLIVRKDLLDDSNAAKDLMDDVKKRLKILLRPGEPEKRPELTWPKSMNKEPVEVVKEVIELLSSFRTIMRKNFETLEVEKIQERWCCGDEPWLFRERWEKLFEDFCDVEQKKFDPSRASVRIALFDLVAPQEYGIEPEEKEEIGVLTSLPLLKKVESHIHTLVNLVLQSGLPIANRRIPELDYCSHITFELYERNHGRGKSDKEYSIKLSLSEGAHSSNVLDSTLDARHSLNVQPRRKLTQHLPYSLVIEKLSKHFHRINDDDDTGPDTPYETIRPDSSLTAGITGDSSSDDP
ncbi:unnamed protein product [Mycena citricolor]|uniref:Inositol hexakisphosphate and diphosphoinositol-pentakisphosphate kinase n=1 Tax=Mycena citricolor TaxID=2018698 RepID=A0AAD2K3L9_9AGAR|nr:unnamed protein product [Mycena citricolor]